MQKALIYLLPLVFLCLSSCKKDEPIQSPIPDISSGIFVIGSDEFYEQFKLISVDRDLTSSDGTGRIRIIKLDSYYEYSITISEYEIDVIQMDGRRSVKNKSISIYSDYILTRTYEDEVFISLNTVGDSMFVGNKHTYHKRLEDVRSSSQHLFEVPLLFEEGDTVNWERDYHENYREGTVYNDINIQTKDPSRFITEQMWYHDILDSVPKFVVCQFKTLPPGMDQNDPQAYLLRVGKYGLVEMSLSADTTLKIHRIFTQK